MHRMMVKYSRSWRVFRKQFSLSEDDRLIGVTASAEINEASHQAFAFNMLLVTQPMANDLKAADCVGQWRNNSKDSISKTYSLTLQGFLEVDSDRLIAYVDGEYLDG